MKSRLSTRGIKLLELYLKYQRIVERLEKIERLYCETEKGELKNLPFLLDINFITLYNMIIMEEKKPFGFGNVSGNLQPKKERVKPIEIDIETPLEGFYCNDRIEDNNYHCINDKCRCKYRNYSLDDVIWETNKLLIKNYFTGKKIDEFIDSFLSYDWTSKNTSITINHYIYMIVHNFKFLYGADLLIIEREKEKVNTATEAYNCSNINPDINKYCKGCIIISKNGNSIDYKCRYSFYTKRQVMNEALREYLYNQLKDKELDYWDKVPLTFDWSELTENQIKLVNKLIIKYGGLIPPNLQTIL
jgi:hypothetical protein